MSGAIKRDLKILFLIGVATGLIGFLYFLFLFFTTSVPGPGEVSELAIAESTKIYDRTEEVLLYEIYGEERRTIIGADEIPDIVRWATISIEDGSFYDHGAFDVRGISRAFFINIIRGRFDQGGSTITQQLAKTTFLSPEKTIIRKIKELALAIKLEQAYTKDQILDMYLNQVSYGPNIYGVESASKGFFGKTTQDLSINEAATLAALPKAPSYYSPWGTHKEDLRNRKNFVLSEMNQLGYIDEQQLNDAGEDLPEILPRSDSSIKAPHFSLAIEEYLESKYGEDVLRTAGLKVTTTLDWEMQQIAEVAVKENAERNTEIYKGHNGALVALDPNNGHVLALVGSKDYFGDPEPEGCAEGVSCKFDGNFNIPLQGLRQPGSAFKPFVYMTAFQEGMTPDTVLWDVPTEFSVSCPPNCYSPSNFDLRFRGPMTMAAALSQSVNVPAVKTLYLVGLSDAVANAELMGVKTFDDPQRFGLSLVLGGGEVKMIELVNAYATLANDGLYNNPVMVLKVESSDGEILEEFKQSESRVVDSQSVRQVNNILSSVELRSALYSSSLGLTIVPGYQLALKTGTTNDYRDAWAFGYTPNLTVGVWAGNNDRTPLTPQGSSILAALPMWHAFLSEALPLTEAEMFPSPEPVLSDNPILSGKLVDGELHSILYYLGREGDSQYQNWEEGIEAWLSANGKESIRIPIITNDDLDGGGPLSIKIDSPKDKSVVKNPFDLEIDIKSEKTLKRVRVYVENDLILSKNGDLGDDFTIKERIDLDNLEGKSNLELKVEIKDEDGDVFEKNIEFSID